MPLSLTRKSILRSQEDRANLMEEYMEERKALEGKYAQLYQ